jgi:hypothetical protein
VLWLLTLNFEITCAADMTPQTNVAELNNSFAVPSSGKNFDAAPTLL